MRWPVEIEWTARDSGRVYLISTVVDRDDPNCHSFLDIKFDPPLDRDDMHEYLYCSEELCLRLTEEANQRESDFTSGNWKADAGDCV